MKTIFEMRSDKVWESLAAERSVGVDAAEVIGFQHWTRFYGEVEAFFVRRKKCRFEIINGKREACGKYGEFVLEGGGVQAAATVAAGFAINVGLDFGVEFLDQSVKLCRRLFAQKGFEAMVLFGALTRGVRNDLQIGFKSFAHRGKVCGKCFT